MSEAKEGIFRDLTADDPDPETTDIESLCTNCRGNGTKKVVLTLIPFYKEVELMCFECPHCGYRYKEIQSGGKVEEKGIRIVVHVKEPEDLNREVVKSDYTSIKIADVDFEIPSHSQKGGVTTVDGVLDRTILKLEEEQKMRRNLSETNAAPEDLIEKLKSLREKSVFTMHIEDVSGNSFVGNRNAAVKDSGVEISWFVRTKEQDDVLGIASGEEIGEEKSVSDVVSNTDSDEILGPILEDQLDNEDGADEFLTTHTYCAKCGCSCQAERKLRKIPHFKEVVIMERVCDSCGHRSNEVKSVGGIEPKGVRIEVEIKTKADLGRELLRSDKSKLMIHELEMEEWSYSSVGQLTTVEDLLVSARKDLAEHGGMIYDSIGDGARLERLLKEYDKVLNCERSATLIVDDAAGNSYVQSLADDGPDDGLKITSYERTLEHNEELELMNEN